MQGSVRNYWAQYKALLVCLWLKPISRCPFSSLLCITNLQKNKINTVQLMSNIKKLTCLFARLSPSVSSGSFISIETGWSVLMSESLLFLLLPGREAAIYGWKPSRTKSSHLSTFSGSIKMCITVKWSMQKINMQQTEKERDQEVCKIRHGQNDEE